MNSPDRFSIQVALITLVRIIFNTAYRMVYPFLPPIARALGVSEAALALSVSARAYLGILGPFLGSIADTRSRRFGMLLGLGIFTAGVAVVVFVPTFPAFVISLVLSNLGSYVFLPASQAYLGDHVPYARRGFVMAITELSWSASFIFGIPLAGFLIARHGWTAPFPLFTILAAAGFVGLWRMLPRQRHTRTAPIPLWQTLRAVLRCQPALAGLLMSASVTAANEVINIIFGGWMERTFGLAIAGLGAAALIIGLSELGGEGLSGIAADRLGKPRAVAAGLLLNALAAVSLPLLGGSVAGALAGLFLFYISFEFTIVSSLPLMTEVMPASRATFMALNVAAFSLGRALGNTAGVFLFEWGIGANAAAAALLNLLAYLALRRVKLA